MNGWLRNRQDMIKMQGFRFLLVLLLVGICYIGPGYAGELGDAAPPLKVSKWIKGKPVNVAQNGKKEVYVIVFWSTGCPHCLEAMDFINDLGKTLKKHNVVFIGVTDDNPEEIEAFGDSKKNKINYRITLDDNDQTKELYMESFNIEGVPHAFIVNQEKKIAWEGHPLDGMDAALKAILDGSYDLRGKQLAARAKRLATAYVYMAALTREDDLTKEIGLRAFQYGKNDANFLSWFASIIIEDQKQPDLDLAYQIIKRSYDLSGDHNYSVLTTYAKVLQKMGKEKEADLFRQKALKLKDSE